MPGPALPPDDARRARGYRLASVLSYVLNPLVLPPVAFALAQWHLGAGALEIAWTAAISLAFFCLIPLLYVVGMVRRGEAESLEVRAREQRTRPFVVGALSYAIGLLVLALTVRTGLRLIVALAALFPLNTAVITLINLRWKISVHMTSLAGFCSMLLFVALTAWRGLPPEWEAALTLASVAPLLVLVPLLMWARVRVGAHTPGQVLAGALFGLFVPLAELYVLVYHVLDLV
jgi:membrane-associated phospholipid phosphatase